MFLFVGTNAHAVNTGVERVPCVPSKIDTCVCVSLCVCVPTVRVSAHGEVQHSVAELVLRLLLQLLTQTLQGSLVLNDINSSQLQSISQSESLGVNI